MNKSFLKWAGGKSRIFEKIRMNIRNGNQIDNRFFEPFFGSGVISLNIIYPSFIVNDANIDLINVWKNLQKFNTEFIEDCKTYFITKNNTKKKYYEFRDEFNNTEDKYLKSLLFVYLNRHCFNGLCRYNKSGGFNVPIGSYSKPYFPEKEMIRCLDLIKKFKFYSKDFRKIFDMVKRGDMVYCDPPYLPLTETANFTNYSKDGFNMKDQEDLAQCAYDASCKGVRVVISNHYTKQAEKLYKEQFGAKMHKIKVSRTISQDAANRKPVNEVIAIFFEKE